MLFSGDEFQFRTLRLGTILAGGRSRRYGSPKPVAPLGGATLVERVAEALRQAGVQPVAIVARDSPPMSHFLPCREDRVAGRGPLGGLFTALDWASELGAWGTLCVGCDTPFLPVALLRRLSERGETVRDQVVIPESDPAGRIEPLCAWYPTSALGEVRHRLEMGALSLHELVGALPSERIPFSEVLNFGDPDTIFMNINTPADRARAAAIDPDPRGRGEHG